MLPLDVRTLMMMFTVNVFAVALALPAIMGWRIGPAARQAVLSTGLQALGWFGLVLSTLWRDLWPDQLLSTLAMAGISAGLVTLWRALALWTGREGRAWPLWTLTGLMTLGYGLGFDSYPWRVGLANGVLGLQMLAVTHAALRHSPQTGWRWRALIGSCMAAMAVATFWRGVLGAFFTASYPYLTAPHPVNQAAAVLSHVTLLLLTVGKPNDLDQYEGRYGIEDTRMALLEARREGLHPFCVTIDQEADDYLPYLFGKDGFVLIRYPEHLPRQLLLLYTRLTG